MKNCRVCNLLKEESEFHKSPAYKDGLRRECRICVSEYEKKLKTKTRQIPLIKICSYCKTEKCAEEFRKNSKNKDGLRSECKDCGREQEKKYRTENSCKGFFIKLKHRYNLSKEDYLFMMESQNGRCAICNIEDKLCVDHNHVDDKIRGLLCHRCNSGLGLFLEDTSILESAIKYIRNNK